MPLQPQTTQVVPAEKQHKRGPGTRRTAASVTGPNIKTPAANPSRQSSRSVSGSASSDGTAEKAKVIDRANLTPGQYENYGCT